MVDEATGDVHTSSPSGSANATWGWGVGLGRTLASGPTVLVRPEMLGRAPFNDYTLSQFALQVGVEWPLGRNG